MEYTRDFRKYARSFPTYFQEKFGSIRQKIRYKKKKNMDVLQNCLFNNVISGSVCVQTNTTFSSTNLFSNS